METVRYYTFLFVFVLVRANTVETSDEDIGGSDTVQDESVEEFKRLCPFTDLCFSKARSNFTRRGSLSAPCCSPCDCDDNCGTACCPDKSEHFLNEAMALQVLSAPEQCIYAQIRPFNGDKYNYYQYRMIGNCPSDYKNEDVKQKCSRKYSDFNFGIDDFQTLMPVSSATMNVTFKNYFCAICHDAPQEQLHFWDTKAVCRNRRKLSISNLHEIPKKLSEEPDCQVLFSPSISTPRYVVNNCYSIIDECNITGDWAQYDPKMELACLSYTSVYEGYKNVHCFLCNGHTFTDVESVCEYGAPGSIDSFVALLDFNNLESPPVDSRRIACSDGTKYDPIKDICRPLTCASGLILSNDRCIPLYKEVDFLYQDIVFGLRFNLLPTHMAAKDNWMQLTALALSVPNDVTQKIGMLNTASRVHLCAFNAYVKLKHSLEDTVTLMNRDNLTDFVTLMSHVAIMIDISFAGLKNSSATLEEMAMLFATNDYYAQYTIQFPADDDGIRDLAGLNRNKSEEFERNLYDLFLDPYQHIMFSEGSNDPSDGLGILTFPGNIVPSAPRCEADLLIQPSPFCPRIELNSNNFDLDLENNLVTNVGKDDVSDTPSLNMKFSKMFSTKYGHSVFVCANEYFSQLPSSEMSSSPSDKALGVLSIVCLTCSVISLIVTFIVYCILSELRTLPGLNNMALVFHLFFAHILALVLVISGIEVEWLCSAVGIFLHFTLVSSFFWMFICTFHMMNVFVKIKEKPSSVQTRNLFIRYFIFTESVSVSLVIAHIVVAILTGEDSEGFGYGGTSCYIRSSYMILYFVAAPLGLVLVANFGMFVFVIWKISRLPDMAKNRNHERNNLLIFCKLSTLTGITYVFGFLHQLTDLPLFAYIYIVFNAGQGVFIMFSFVNKRVFNMLRTRWNENTESQTDGTTRSVRVTASENGDTNNTNKIPEHIDLKKF